MRNPLKLTLIAAVLAAAQQVAAAGSSDAAGLTWQELSRRPELWPAQCTLQSAIHLQGGVSVPAGQKLNVFDVKPDEADVSTIDGKTNFAVEPDESDLLAVACTSYAELTPKQRALTYAAVAQQKELWPAQVALKKTMQFDGGTTVHEGDRFPVLEIHPDKLLVKFETLNSTFYVTPPATDLMTQARQLVENPQAAPRFVDEQRKMAEEQQQVADKQRKAGEQRMADQQREAKIRVLGEIEGKLVNSVTDKPEPLDPAAPPRYLVFFRGSSTCPITRKFAPTLIKYYNQMKPRHPEFEVIWIMTESPEDTGKFARKLGFSWRAVTYESTSSMPTVSKPINGLLPQLIVMDQSGKILANGWQETAPTALQQLDALLKHPAGQM